MGAVCGVTSSSTHTGPLTKKSIITMPTMYLSMVRQSEVLDRFTFRARSIDILEATYMPPAVEHVCIFWPKFHPRLKHDRFCWESWKRILRSYSDYTLHKLKTRLGVHEMCAYERHCQRHMKAYREGHTGYTVGATLKTFKSHRRVFRTLPFLRSANLRKDKQILLHGAKSPCPLGHEFSNFNFELCNHFSLLQSTSRNPVP